MGRGWVGQSTRAGAPNRKQIRRKARRHPSLEDHDHHELPHATYPDEGVTQVTFDDQTVSTRDRGQQERSESTGSTVFPGDLLGGRSPAERVQFLAGPPVPAEPSATTAVPRPRVYRDYTRRLRDK